MDDFGFYFKNYKQFNDWQAFCPLNKVNLVIGKNNAGKTKLCEVAKMFYSPNFSSAYGGQAALVPCLFAGPQIPSNVADQFFNNRSEGNDFCDTFDKGMPISISHISNDPVLGDLLNTRFPNLSQLLRTNPSYASAYYQLRSVFRGRFSNERTDHPFLISYIHSDRKVTSCSINEMVYKNGVPEFEDNDATRLTYYYLNYINGDVSVILEKVLNALNRVMGEEGRYSSVSVVQVTNDPQNLCDEVFLEDAHTKKRYALSECGNGLQTIFLVLLSLYANKPNEKALNRLFIFEELENNLHPYAERRLYQLILEYAREEPNRRFIITTHSNAAIDVFCGSPDCSLFSVEKDQNNPEYSVIKPITDNDDTVKAIDNLGVKASDLLQANGLLWVEGPSDRLYLNHWIHLLDPNLVENIHYQYAYYGGRLLAHYTAAEEESLIRILKINQHSALFMDSDKSQTDDAINATKERILSEMGNDTHPAFVTAGREIENYIPVEVLRKITKDDPTYALKPFDDIAPFARKVLNDNSANPNHFDKIGFANLVCPLIDEKNFDVLGLRQIIQKVVDCIKKWNDID